MSGGTCACAAVDMSAMTMQTRSARPKLLVLCRTFISPPMSQDDSSRLDVIQVGKILVEIGVAFLLDAFLIRPHTAGRAFAVIGVQLIDHFHSGHDFAERREALRIQSGVVAVI